MDKSEQLEVTQADRRTMKCPHCDGTGEIVSSAVHFGHIIMERRKALGITQDELGKRVRKSRTQITNIEAGRTDPSVSQLRAYADALECQMKDLLP